MTGQKIINVFSFLFFFFFNKYKFEIWIVWHDIISCLLQPELCRTSFCFSGSCNSFNVYLPAQKSQIGLMTSVRFRSELWLEHSNTWMCFDSSHLTNFDSNVLGCCPAVFLPGLSCILLHPSSQQLRSTSLSLLNKRLLTSYCCHHLMLFSITSQTTLCKG